MKDFTDNKLLQDLSQKLIRKKLTVAVAESVTCGLLQHSFSHVDDTMKFFQGGLTVYNLGQKVKQLNVDPIVAEEVNCVSGEVAEKMALEVAIKFCSTMGVGITGYAKPVPEVGVNAAFAYVAISNNGKIQAVKKINGTKDAPLAENQELYVEKTLMLLSESLKK